MSRPDPEELARAGRSRAGPWRGTCLARGFRGRCPRCGRGALLASWTRPNERCAECGHLFRRESGAMTGSMYVSAVATELFAAAVIFAVVLGTDWGLALSLAVSIPLVLAFCAWFLPRSIGLWAAVELLTDLHNGEPWARPLEDRTGGG